MAPFALFSLLNAPVSRHPGKILCLVFFFFFKYRQTNVQEKSLVRLITVINVGGCCCTVPSHAVQHAARCLEVFSFLLAKQTSL